MKRYEVYVYGTVFVNANSEDSAIDVAIEEINNNSKQYVEVKKVEK